MAKAPFRLTRAGYREAAAEVAGMRKRLKEMLLRLEDGAFCGDDFIEKLSQDAAEPMSEAADALARLAAVLHH